MTEEHDRIRAEYERRECDDRYGGMYAPDSPVVRATLRNRTRAIERLLLAHGIPLGNARVVDVGCGSGGELRRISTLDGTPAALVGIDLLPFRLLSAPAACPSGLFCAADGAAMPFHDGSFDLAMLFTVLSSILDPDLRRGVAGEVDRVLRPGGALLWYDFRWNPTNRQTTGIGVGEVAQLFPSYEHDVRRTTLAPPIARAIAGRAPSVAARLERVPLLLSHNVGLAIKPPGVGE